MENKEPFAITIRFHGSSITFALSERFIAFVQETMKEKGHTDIALGILNEDQKFTYINLGEQDELST